ncbi:sigma-70 family RNA polymerase sigma factor [Pseudoroseomonas wenyumeiae]
MVAAQDGNGGAYKRLLADLAVWLHRYFSRRLPRAEVDDAVQEALLAVHRSRHTYDPRYPFLVWVSAIAKRKWVDQLRALEHRSADELTDTVATPDHEAAVIGASVLTSLLGELRPAQSQVIQLVKLEGYSLEEASSRTGQSIAAVKVNIHRGIARLRALIMGNTDVA